jgi:hypothetical protein
MNDRALPPAIATLCLAMLILPFGSSGTDTRQAPLAEPTTALAYFRRADDLTNIRMPESAPFRLRARFHAYPGYDFTKAGQSPIVTGDGTYEETWLAPNQWRREITLGSYHAVEVRAGGVRKFQASSDYEPSRVIMFLRGLLDPMPRYLLEPEIEERHLHWKVEHLTAGSLSYVHIGFTDYARVSSVSIPCPRSYDFVLKGMLFRASDYNGLVTTWQDPIAFNGTLVPRHFAVQGDGLEGQMLSADVSIQPALPGDSVPQIPGGDADPGMTLRAFDELDLGRPEPIHVQIPEGWASFDHSGEPPPEVQVYTVGVVDRTGVPREVELSGVRRFGQPVPKAQLPALGMASRNLVEAFRRDRYHPALLDGKPCEIVLRWSFWTSPVVE